MQKKLFRIISYKVAALFLLHFSTTTNLLGYKQIHSSSSASLMQILKKASPEKPSPIETVEVQDLSATMTSESTETEPEEKNKYEWTLMFYAQAKNNLSSFILNNFNEIAKTLNQIKSLFMYNGINQTMKALSDIASLKIKLILYTAPIHSIIIIKLMNLLISLNGA
ncbi:hypothetical protein JKY79_01430 [Candidatus Babeliales bacterium]|nr:hypothetical protein [Candidatus Babeliales bacterium]